MNRAEQIIDRDREYDQTAVTDTDPSTFCQNCAHRHGKTYSRICQVPGCPCGHDDAFQATVVNHQAARHVSPSILEFRILKLEQDLHYERSEHGTTRELLDIANNRIKGFEQMSYSLAEHIDGIEADFILLTGKGLAEWLAEAKAERESILPAAA